MRKNSYVIGLTLLVSLSMCHQENKITSKRKYFEELSEKFDSPDDRGDVIFKDLSYLHELKLIPDNEFLFAKVNSSPFEYKSTLYQLCFLQNGEHTLTGYWGFRNDTLFFIPYYMKDCLIEYPIIEFDKNRYFEITSIDTCKNQRSPYLSDGYFYKILEEKDNKYYLKYFILPEENITITESSFMKEMPFLEMVISLDKGISRFNYNNDLNKYKIIPWTKEYFNDASVYDETSQ